MRKLCYEFKEYYQVIYAIEKRKRIIITLFDYRDPEKDKEFIEQYKPKSIEIESDRVI